LLPVLPLADHLRPGDFLQRRGYILKVTLVGESSGWFFSERMAKNQPFL
jgi:hypothetical protein